MVADQDLFGPPGCITMRPSMELVDIKLVAFQFKVTVLILESFGLEQDVSLTGLIRPVTFAFLVELQHLLAYFSDLLCHGPWTRCRAAEGTLML